MIIREDQLTPLVTAQQAFPAMEALVLDAAETLDLSLHIFSPRTKTRSARAHDKRLLDWGDLIADAIGRGVQIRLLLNDFDPVGAPDMHATVWERIAHLAENLAGVPPEHRDGLQILVAHPGGQSGALLRTLVWPVARMKQHQIVREFNATGRALPPGLLEAGERAPLWPPRRNFTQTYHQKFLVSDYRRAILGGLDIDERRYDDPDHNRSAPQTWHDVSVEIEGPAAARLAVHFDNCWNSGQTEGFSHAPAFEKMASDHRLTFVPTAARAKYQPNGAEYDKTERKVSVLTTMPRPSHNPLRYGPQAKTRELEAAHLDLFRNARRFIYIETQFFRSSVVRNALVAALGANQDLYVIALLPGAPDVVAYQGEKSGVHRYGEWLQMRALNRLQRLFPDRFAAFSLTNDRPRQEQNERDALHGKSMVYVHSKLAIADDQLAIVSSANLNGRSMQWDVEAGILARDEDFAERLRSELWQAHLGSEAASLDPRSDPRSSFAFWRNSASERQAAGARAKGTGVVPFPLEKTSRFAKRHLFIPEQMV